MLVEQVVEGGRVNTGAPQGELRDVRASVPDLLALSLSLALPYVLSVC